MDATLTPALALDYLRELSTDLRAGAVLDDTGDTLAGPPGVAAAARHLVAACPDARAVEVGVPEGYACVLRSARHALALAVGPLALPRLLFHDMAEVLALLSTPEGGFTLEAGRPAGRGRGARGGAAVRWCPPRGHELVALAVRDPRHAAVARQGRVLLAASR